VAANELYVQIGDQSDNAYWGPPETINYPRPASKIDCDNPGTEPAAETAAAFAAAYLVFRDIDPAYAARLLVHAQQLMSFAYECQGNYVIDGHVYAAAPFY